MKNKRRIIVSLFIMLIVILVQGIIYSIAKNKEIQFSIIEEPVQGNSNSSSINIKDVYKIIKNIDLVPDSILKTEEGFKTTVVLNGSDDYIKNTLNEINENNIDILSYNMIYKEGVYNIKLDVLFKTSEKNNNGI